VTEKRKQRSTSGDKTARGEPSGFAKEPSSEGRWGPDAVVGGEAFGGPERIHSFASTLASRDVGEDETARQRLETWVTFRLAGETFALPVTAVREILRVETITRVPHAPYTVCGIINMRGRVVPVVDFRVRLGLPEAEVGALSRILITSSRDHLIGLLVDAVEQVASLDMNAVQPPPSDIMTCQSQYITGVYQHKEQLVLLLDVEQVLLIPDALEETNRQQTKERARRL